jgi:nucleotide-binding universal stress UspA family protein
MIGATYRVVVGIDFTRTSEVAFAEALALARDRVGAELHVAHVVAERDAARGARLAIDERALDDAYMRLRVLVDEMSRAGEESFQVHVGYHVRLGKPAEALHQVAVDLDADVIVVGTAGKHGVERLLLGSVAERVVSIAHAPVLVARAKDFTGLPKTALPDPVRPGAPLHARRGDLISSSELVDFGPARPAHISGLI